MGIVFSSPIQAMNVYGQIRADPSAFDPFRGINMSGFPKTVILTNER